MRRKGRIYSIKLVINIEKINYRRLTFQFDFIFISLSSVFFGILAFNINEYNCNCNYYYYCSSSSIVVVVVVVIVVVFRYLLISLMLSESRRGQRRKINLCE